MSCAVQKVPFIDVLPWLWDWPWLHIYTQCLVDLPHLSTLPCCHCPCCSGPKLSTLLAACLTSATCVSFSRQHWTASRVRLFYILAVFHWIRLGSNTTCWKMRLLNKIGLQEHLVTIWGKKFYFECFAKLEFETDPTNWYWLSYLGGGHNIQMMVANCS